MRFLVDTNIFLDFFLQRDPFFRESEQLLKNVIAKQGTAFVTATTLTDIFYVARRSLGSFDRANEIVSDILQLATVCPVNESVAELALSSKTLDFEDAIQIECAVAHNLEAIVTRDIKGFSYSPIPALTIAELLTRLDFSSNGKSSN